MKYILTLLLVIINMICFGKVDTCGINFACLVEKQIQTAIDSVSIHIGTTQNNFDVFVLRFYHLDKNKNDSCFTLGYIENSYEFALVHSDYFTEYKGYFVLFRFSDSDYAKGLNALNIKKISYIDEIHIIQRLFPRDAGFMTYDPFGLTTNIKNRTITNSYYENAGEIPENESIYDLYDKGTTWKIDTADFINNIQTRPRKKINQ